MPVKIVENKLILISNMSVNFTNKNALLVHNNSKYIKKSIKKYMINHFSNRTSK